MAFNLRLCTNVFSEVPPPMRRRGYMRLFVCSSSPASCVSCFAKRHPPRSTFGDDDRGTCFRLSDYLIWDLLLLSWGGSCLAFGFRATGLSTRRSSDGILLDDLRLISRRGSCLAFGFRATGLSTRRSSDGIFVRGPSAL